MRLRDDAELRADADRLIRHSEALCARQAAILVRLRAGGQETETAEAMLVWFELTLTQMRLYQARLETEEDLVQPRAHLRILLAERTNR